MRTILLSLIILASAGLGFFITLRLLPDQQPIAQREDIILARADLRSTLPGQPLPEGQADVVDAKVGHQPGHIVYSMPRHLPNGSYRLVITTAALPRTAESSCIMDLLAGDRLIAKAPLVVSQDDDGIDFSSPATNGATEFVARLFCDGREAIRVHEVKFLRNPNSLPAVVYQR